MSQLRDTATLNTAMWDYYVKGSGSASKLNNTSEILAGLVSTVLRLVHQGRQIPTQTRLQLRPRAALQYKHISLHLRQ